MIYLFTDFGYNGPYVGQMKSVLAIDVPHIPVIDLMHDAPAFNPRASGVLLSALVTYMPEESITVAVVDPGVGSPERRPIMIEADNRWYIGPDNGLFQPIINSASLVKCYELQMRDGISKTFHGRDLFAPAAAQLALHRQPAAKKMAVADLNKVQSVLNMCEIIYIDNYGNAMTGINAEGIDIQQSLIIEGIKVSHAEFFSNVKVGNLFWYVNSIGLVEISANSSSAAEVLGLSIGKVFELE